MDLNSGQMDDHSRSRNNPEIEAGVASYAQWSRMVRSTQSRFGRPWVLYLELECCLHRDELKYLIRSKMSAESSNIVPNSEDQLAEIKEEIDSLHIETTELEELLKSDEDSQEPITLNIKKGPSKKRTFEDAFDTQEEEKSFEKSDKRIKPDDKDQCHVLFQDYRWIQYPKIPYNNESK